MTVARNLIKSGYDYLRQYTFKKDGVVEDLSTATSIKCSVKNYAKTLELITDTAQTNTGSASWVAGLVNIAFTASQTAALTAQDAWIEVEVTLGGIRLPYDDIPVTIEIGWVLT